MNEAFIMIAVGAISAGMGATVTFNEAFATRYVRTSPKAWLWRKLLGEARATVAVRRVFGPIGMLLGTALAVFGLVMLQRAG